MNKQILTIGYEIPGYSDNCVSFGSNLSLMDADVLLISTESLLPWGDWVSFTSSDGGCYNVEASNIYKKRMNHLRKEIRDHLNSGKNIFIFLNKEIKTSLANSVSSQKKGQRTYNTELYSNYNFLPIEIGKRTNASGKKVLFSGQPIFSEFHNKYKNDLDYDLYIEDPSEAQIVFTGKDETKILGAVYKVGLGHLVTLPLLDYDAEDFTEIREDDNCEEKEIWNKKGLAFGNSFVKCLLDIDRKLACDSEKSPTPNWVSKKLYLGSKEKEIHDSINSNIEDIAKITQKNEKLKIELEEERRLKDLLFEQGKPLENSVIIALEILGYKAENYNDGILEMDQVIISPENNRYIGETEGKDNKDINITKFRQLVDSLNEDFSRDEVKEKAFGILFGNAERLKEPAKRKLDFTTKCISGAQREKIALVRTIDFFVVAKYLNENNDENFRKDCRDAIHKGLGKIVEFPEIPNR
jgi:hypothetical protein